MLTDLADGLVPEEQVGISAVPEVPVQSEGATDLGDSHPALAGHADQLGVAVAWMVDGQLLAISGHAHLPSAAARPGPLPATTTAAACPGRVSPMPSPICGAVDGAVLGREFRSRAVFPA
jgi:hypothetical protein